MAAAASSAAANMEPPSDRRRAQHPQMPMQMRQYRGYSVRSMPLDRRHENDDGGAGPSLPVQHIIPQEREIQNIEEDDEDEEGAEEDHNLMRQMRLPPPIPVPGQLDRFQRYLRVGFFIASVEVLTDRANGNIEEIREYAERKVAELIASTGEVIEPEVPEKALCGSPKIKRDLKRMSKHLDFYNELFLKFVMEFDGSRDRLNKLRRATGFIKGILVLDNMPVFNIPLKYANSDYVKDLDIFKVNALLFMQYLKSFQVGES